MTQDLISGKYYASSISLTGRRAVKIFVLTVEMSLHACKLMFSICFQMEKKLDYMMTMTMITATLMLMIMLKTNASSSESNRQKH